MIHIAKNKCDYCLVYHGDDQANIKDFKKIFLNKSYNNFDAVLGARFLKDSKLINYQLYRILGNKIFPVCIKFEQRFIAGHEIVLTGFYLQRQQLLQYVSVVF